MLKDKYRFKLSQHEAQLLRQNIENMFVRYSATAELELQLPLAVMMDFQKRLVGALLFPADKLKIYLKRTEAIAFQLLYLNDIIKTDLVTMQISYEIDHTL